MNDGDDEDPREDQTNPGSPVSLSIGRTDAELAEDVALFEAADSVGRIARVVAENLRLVREVPRDRRERVIAKVALLLGELGDRCHEQRRIILRMESFKW